MRIAIVGAGIVGVALAAKLSALNHVSVQLFEAAPEFSEIGAGISFGPNALKALEQLGYLDDYLAVADSVPAPYQDIYFQWRNGYTGEYLSETTWQGVGQSSIHRADFLDALIEHVNQDDVYFNKKLTQILENQDHIQLSFQDGTEFECDYLIGADGIHSLIRQYVLKAQDLAPSLPRFSGTWAYRGIIAYSDYKDALVKKGLSVDFADIPQMFLAKNKHVLTYPLRKGQLINIVAFMSNPEQRVLPEGQPWVVQKTSENLLDDFAEFTPECTTLLSLIQNPNIWALHAIDPIDTYLSPSKRVIVIGDAAHAMVPHQGAGAGAGLEDAVILYQLFKDERIDVKDLGEISSIYEDIRKPRSQKNQLTAFESGLVYELNHPDYPVIDQDLAQHLAHRFDWIWGHDLQEDLNFIEQRLKQVFTMTA